MMEDIRDIKGVIGVWDIFSILFIVFCVLLLAISIYFLYKLILSKKQNKTIEVIEKKDSYDVIALKALDGIDPVAFFDKGLIKEYYISISEIIRFFFGENYLIDTMDKTSYELLDELERVERDYEKIKRIDRIFSDWDIVKFAKHRPSLADMKIAKEEAKRIIIEYRKNK